MTMRMIHSTFMTGLYPLGFDGETSARPPADSIPVVDLSLAPPGAAVHVPILTSKIVPDRPPANMVVRDRLEELLDTSHQVVVVSAPAGYGKSALVASWVSHRDVRVAWTGLDHIDRNPVVFWRHVIASIARVIPEAVEADRILLESADASGLHVSALAHIVLSKGEPLVLVLDDLHLVGNEIRDDLVFLVERCQPVLRLVAICRHDAVLPLGRWRAEQRVLEIRENALAFRVDEADQLLSHYRLGEVDSDDLERLLERTEGWVVGLLLSAMAVADRSDVAARMDAVIESDRHLTDYLGEEVLERLPQDLRWFALELSVLPVFDAGLAARVTGRPDAATLLHQLVESNPFVVSASTGHGHRFHHLIRELLAAEFHRRDPLRAVELRRCAAAAMLERGVVDVAVELLLDLGDVDAAFDAVVRPVLDISDAGRLLEFRQWFDLLPQLHPEDFERAIDYASALVMAGRTDEAILWSRRAAELRPDPSPAETVLQAVVLMVALGAGGRITEAAECLPVLENVHHDATGSPRLDARMAAQVVRLATELGDLDRAERWLPDVARHPNPAIGQSHLPALGAMVRLARGDVHEALVLSERASALLVDSRLGPHPVAIDVHVARGQALLARLRLDEAAVVLERLAEVAGSLRIPWFDLRVRPLVVEHTALTQGWPSALELVSSWRTGAGHGGEEDITPPDLATRLDQLTARALLGCGRGADADAVIERLPPSPRRDLLQAHAALVSGRVDGVEQALAEHETWELPERLEALLLLAQARPAPANDDTIRVALGLASSSGWLAPFALGGRPLGRLLDGLPLDELHPDLAAWRRESSGRPRERARSIETLTAKEHEVLARLPSHLTYQGIGSELYLSVNTVKTYVSAVYRKLGVSSRSEAVAVARAAGLLKG
jgi:LuxR family transcriptional regulator, maltose regulon positive regulatory protein